MSAWRRVHLLGLLGALLAGSQALAHGPTQLSTWTRLLEIDLQPELVRVRYGLAAGEALGLSLRQAMDLDRDGVVSEVERQAYAASVASAVADALQVTLDGVARDSRFASARVILDDTRVLAGQVHLELEWSAELAATASREHALILQDRSALPALHDTRIDIAEQGGTRLLWSQLDDGPRLQRQLFDFVRLPPDRPYRLGLVWREHGGAEIARAVTGDAGASTRRDDPEDALARLVAHDGLSPRLIALALLLALALGALHALSPGHGKTLVAAYLVGRRGTVGQAVLLGLVVTATHVASVLALGVVTLWLSTRLMPEQVLPWLELGSGLLILGLGLWLLGARWRAWRQERAHDHAHPHDHVHPHDHLPRADDGQPAGLWEILVLGITGGLVPCPSALVVLLTAVALQRIALGLLLIAVFSLGLASVLVALGILVVKARQRLDRLRGSGRLLRALPVVSAGLVTAFGVLLVLESSREVVRVLGGG